MELGSMAQITGTELLLWHEDVGTGHLMVVTDNKALATQLNEGGESGNHHRDQLNDLLTLQARFAMMGWKPGVAGGSFVQCRRRHWNQEADWLVNWAFGAQQNVYWRTENLLESDQLAPKSNLLLRISDGGHRGYSQVAAGWILRWVENRGLQRILQGGATLHLVQNPTAYEAEKLAMTHLRYGLVQQFGQIQVSDLQRCKPLHLDEVDGQTISKLKRVTYANAKFAQAL